MPFTDDAVTNPRGDHLDCAKHRFKASTTLGRRCRRRRARGSWDRRPPRPPVVYWLPWEAKTHTLGPAIVLISGFLAANGTRWGRLADAVAGPDGSLYVTDDQSGAVYRITP